MAKKIRVGILFGGQSAEHEVSVQSARSIIEHLDQEKYEAIPIGIDREGNWFFLTKSQFLLLFETEKLPAFEKKEGSFFPAGIQAKDLLFSPYGSRECLDVIFPALHGPFGEDGTVQGLIKLVNLPFVGSDVLGSAICMDKEVMKRLLREAGFPIPRFRCLKIYESLDLQALVGELGLPLFVKPANLGSSVGISKVCSEKDLLPAIEHAFQYDEKILIEAFIDGREIECAVLGNLDPKASLPGEIIPCHAFYSYEAKYRDKEGAFFKLPAELGSQTVVEIQKLAVKAFQSLECTGMARVDFFLQKDGKLFLNELNTIPGFTTISLYPSLWELSGISYPKLLDQLIQLALEQHQRKKALNLRILPCLVLPNKCSLKYDDVSS